MPRQTPNGAAAASTSRSRAAQGAPPSSMHSLAPSTVPRPSLPARSIKVVLIGDGGCGKTSLRNHFLSGQFTQNYRATIGADFITKSMPAYAHLPHGERVTLQIWDTAGQERFQSLGSAFYRGADAVIIAFDLSLAEPKPIPPSSNNGGPEGSTAPSTVSSLDRIPVWYDAFMQKAPGPRSETERRRFCWICVGNKLDLVQRHRLAGAEREKVRGVLDSLVPYPPGQPDYGLEGSASGGDDEAVAAAAVPASSSSGGRPSGAKKPADPEEVLQRPDPNRRKQQQSEASATLSRRGQPGARTRNLSEAADFQTPSGTISTLTGLPPGLNVTRGDVTVHHKRGGHQKRQSIRSIDVFQPQSPDELLLSDDADGTASSRPNLGRSKSTGSAVQPPSTPTQGDEGRRQRVDSTMSVGAPSIYHTPRSSAFFGTSPSATSVLGGGGGGGGGGGRSSVTGASGTGGRSAKLSTTSNSTIDSQSTARTVGAAANGTGTATATATTPTLRDTAKLSTSPGPLSFLESVNTLQSPPGIDRGRPNAAAAQPHPNRLLPSASGASRGTRPSTAAAAAAAAAANGEAAPSTAASSRKTGGVSRRPFPSSAGGDDEASLTASFRKIRDVVPSASGAGLVPSGDPIPFPSGDGGDDEEAAEEEGENGGEGMEERQLYSDVDAVEVADGQDTSIRRLQVVPPSTGDDEGKQVVGSTAPHPSSAASLPPPNLAPSSLAPLRDGVTRAPTTALDPTPPSHLGSTPAPGTGTRQGQCLEEGFTLFYTSAKTGTNVERLFRHVVDRVVARWVEEEAEESSARVAGRGGGGEERMAPPALDRAREEEMVRRGIRLAAGKDPEVRSGWRACCS